MYNEYYDVVHLFVEYLRKYFEVWEISFSVEVRV